MATPLLAVLRRAYLEARIDFAVGPWSWSMVENNPKIDDAVDCGPVGGGPYSLRDYLSLVRRMREGEYEACFVLDRSPLVSLLPFWAGIPPQGGPG
jgi:ADP-heptose:LPS heptosyltransferase